ncbi:MAG: NADH-quinone oxidoreductase subunit J [Proteobacteria bacterium]|nr:NADH-quinone oxidoreductase subunit J [Pseudomonadota bacterium]
MIQVAAFYLFASVLTACALAVICARNPVHSVLFLIACFFSAAGLFVLLGAEFIALILVIVYVGAVAVLFLFVVMMLDISFQDLRRGAMQYVPLGLGIGLVLLVELFTLYRAWPERTPVITAESTAIENTEALGRIIYTDYLFAFQVSGLILFVAMIGAIVLTHRCRPDVRRQKVAEQNRRKPSDVLEIKKVSSGSGA